MAYTFDRTVDLDFEEAIERFEATLADEGFGILTEIDVKATLKKKLGIERNPYRILGACNPEFAHQALEAELPLGALLPCNGIVYVDDNDRTHVAGVDPVVMLSVVDNDDLDDIAAEIKTRMERAVNNV